MHDNLGYLFQHTAASLAHQADQELLKKVGIGYSQFKLLMVLEWNPHIKQKEIAEKLGQTEASISRQMKLMQQDGLVRSNFSPTSKREHIVSLTARGEQLAARANHVLNQMYIPILQKLGESRQDYLMQSITALHDESCRTTNGGRCTG